MDEHFFRRPELQRFQPSPEHRRGKKRYILLYIVACSTGIFSLVMFPLQLGCSEDVSFVLAMSSVLMLPLMMYLTAKEISLVTQNCASDIAKSLSPWLLKDETVLVVLAGKGYSTQIPEWINDDVYPCILFLFTSHRLLIVTLKRSMIGLSSIEAIIRHSDFTSTINTLHSCHYSKPNTIRLRSIFPNLLMAVAYRKLFTLPEGENEGYTWAISSQCAAGKNSRLLLKCFERRFYA